MAFIIVAPGLINDIISCHIGENFHENVKNIQTTKTVNTKEKTVILYAFNH
jgi:hypothetical protein